ncbi:Vegetative incompatibility protein HET-E-1 [Colletotrichum siamense]|uniref:Vegetative incompatibility protein HET-E-1 n=1 Tax=Colletotrichum siamense TaxID=690259 RepID=UPI0018722BF8|nr:Vegetative incompatibility protein HET-E-1 [Colletotrichum siamense]KAF5491669.1 Vegetative incompatibility protein HET-E-1 [Colletotrichum siamense]
MRLLNTTTLRLADFVGKAPPYAILSHTWGDEEVLFADVSNPAIPKAGWSKVRSSCNLARNLGHTWIWIDTCCIDKSSSAELSEAINSMFKFYQKAVICIAYLSDIMYPDSKTDIPKDIPKSRWFTRGWTLQELLAPRNLDFYSSDWKLLGSRSEFRDLISRVTGIGRSFIGGGDNHTVRLATASVAERMSWASKRRTTRPEDIAYCLLGIFGINMPLIYGEGDKAFRRLQQAILYEIDDPSIFAWGYKQAGVPATTLSRWTSPLIAGHPSWFRESGDIVPFFTADEAMLTLHAGIGVTITTPLMQELSLPRPHQQPHQFPRSLDGDKTLPYGAACMPEHTQKGMEILLAPLKCRRKSDHFNCIAIPLCKATIKKSVFDNHVSFSCYRVSHAIFYAPRSVWMPENLCKPLIHFQSNFDKESMSGKNENGCIIRTLPHGYSLASHYYSTSNILNPGPHKLPNIIPTDQGHWNLIKLEGKSPPSLALVVAGPRAYTAFLPSPSATEDVPYMTSNRPLAAEAVMNEIYSLRPSETFKVSVTQSAAYGSFIWLVDVVDLQGANTSMETDALTGAFAPIRPWSPIDRNDADERVQSHSLRSSSYSTDLSSLRIKARNNSSCEAVGGLTPPSDGTYDSQEL